MKPRKRLEQKQYGSMYLRDNYHRDAIYQDMYHNAIWLKREQDGKEIDEVGWIRYPKEAIYGSYDLNIGGWMDINRQFQFGRSFPSGADVTTHAYYLRDQNILVHCSSTYNGRVVSNLISEDGIVWTTVETPAWMYDCQYFADDSVFKLSSSQYNSTYSFTIYTPIKNPDKKSWSIKQRTFTINGLGIPKFICNTHNGVIMTEMVKTDPDFERYSLEYVLIDYSGTRTSLSKGNVEWPSVWPISSLDPGAAYASCGNKMCQISYARWGKDRYSGWHAHRVVLCSSGDGGVTWHCYSIFGDLGDSTPFFVNEGADAFVRDGCLYVTYGMHLVDNGNFHMWKSSDGVNWTEVSLPSMISVPLLKNGGSYVDSSRTATSVKIGFKGETKDNVDVMAYNLTTPRRFKSNFNLKARDGEFCDNYFEPFYLTLGKSNFRVYLDTETLISTERAFCWYLDGNAAEVPEMIQQYDYCVRGAIDTTTPETPGETDTSDNIDYIP